MLTIKSKAKLLSAISAPYDFNGNSGVSHGVRVSIDDEIYPLKCTEDQVDSLQSSVGKEGTANIEIRSRRERITCHLVSFEVTR